MSTSEEINVGLLVYRERIKRDLTRKELAEKVGITSEYVRLLEQGRRRPSRRTINKILDVLVIRDVELDATLQSRGRGCSSRTRDDIIAELDQNMAVRDRITKKFWEASEKLADEWETLMEELKDA